MTDINNNNSDDVVVVSDDLPPSSHFRNRKVIYPIIQLFALFFLCIFYLSPSWSRTPKIDGMLNYTLAIAILSIVFLAIMIARAAVIVCGKYMLFLPQDAVQRNMAALIYAALFALVYIPLNFAWFIVVIVNMSKYKKYMMFDMESFDYNLAYVLFAFISILLVINMTGAVFDITDGLIDVDRARKAHRVDERERIASKYKSSNTDDNAQQEIV